MLEVHEVAPGIRSLTFSNAGKKNALDDGLLEAIGRELSRGDGVRCWLVRSSGENMFSAGYDLSALDAVPVHAPLPDDLLADVLHMLSTHSAPSVALVNGAAFGAGCELALACDFRVGGPAAAFCLPPAKLGIVYSLTGLERAARVVGLQRARLMFLTGRRIDAETANAWGLLDVLTQAGQEEAQALALCNELASGARQAIAGMKRGLRLIGAPSIYPEAEEEYRALRRAAFNGEEAKEGQAAFREKRPPRFS
ncbi:MAG: enoyl-CoA hydratase/isomerase family protein [Myxococcaceae bacterium]|nr:enoyl-CoA hydratase/isomerase family protein [Myxococcaceae bacterium]